MDPVSIVTLSGSVAKICYEIAATLFNFARDAKDIDDNLNAFATEVSSFSLTLKAVTSTLNDPKLGFSDISKDTNPDVWDAVGGSIESLKRFLDKLRQELEEISSKTSDRNIFRQAMRAFELRLKKESVNGLRSTLRTHQLSLNTALVMVQLYAQARLPSQIQPDLRPNILRLRSMADDLPDPGALTTSDTGDDQNGPNNIAQLKKVTMAVLSNASERAYSAAGSEYGAPFDRDRVREWIQLSKTAEVPPLEGAFLSNAPDQASRASISEGTVIGRELPEDAQGHVQDETTEPHQIPRSATLDGSQTLMQHQITYASSARVERTASSSRLTEQSHFQPSFHPPSMANLDNPRAENISEPTPGWRYGYATAMEEAAEDAPVYKSEAPSAATDAQVSSPISTSQIPLTFSSSTSPSTVPNPPVTSLSQVQHRESALNAHSLSRSPDTSSRGYQVMKPLEYHPNSPDSFPSPSHRCVCLPYRSFSYILTFLRTVQLGLGITACVVYSYGLKTSVLDGEAVDSRWVYAATLGGLTAFYVGILGGQAFMLHDEECLKDEGWFYMNIVFL